MKKPLKLKAGKRYVTRAGWITPPATDNQSAPLYPFRCGINEYTGDGFYYASRNPCSQDLVAEYTEPPEPVKAPLEKSDVPLLSLLRVGECDPCLVTFRDNKEAYWPNPRFQNGVNGASYGYLMTKGWEISRDNGQSWAPCWKEGAV